MALISTGSSAVTNNPAPETGIYTGPDGIRRRFKKGADLPDGYALTDPEERALSAAPENKAKGPAPETKARVKKPGTVAARMEDLTSD